jgi:hypothetical protein
MSGSLLHVPSCPTLTEQVKRHLTLIIYQMDGVMAHGSCRWPHTAGKRVQPQATICATCG